MKKRKNPQLIFLLTIILISSVIRLYQLGKVPNGLSADETDVGYNAYSVLKTGKDVYNRKYPLFFQSFDIYQPPFQAYISIPAIYYFGLNEFSMRIAPAIIGVVTALLIFFLSKLLFPKLIPLAYISAIMMTFAPWNIAVSRAQMVTIEVVFFYLLFLILFLISVKKNVKYLPISFLVLGFTIYDYHIAIIYLPLIIAICLLIYKKVLLKNLRLIFLSLILILITMLPAINFYRDPDTRNRFNTISIFIPDITLPTSISEIEYDQKNGTPIADLIHNRRLVYLSSFLENYFEYFSLDNIFVSSKNIRYFYINNVGLLYLIEFPFVIWGFYILFKRRKPEDLLVLSLLFISPVPAAMSLGSPFFHRAPLFLPLIQLISAIGIYDVYKTVKSTKIKCTFTIIYLVSFCFFLHQYFVHSPQEFHTEFDNGAWYSTMKNAIPIINANYDKYDKIVFTTSRERLMPYVYYLFYNQIDPRTLQEKAAKWTNERPSYSQIYTKIGKIDFRPINWELDKNLENTLLIGYANEFPKEINSVVAKTYLPNGNPHFIFVEDH